MQVGLHVQLAAPEGFSACFPAPAYTTPGSLPVRQELLVSIIAFNVFVTLSGLCHNRSKWSIDLGYGESIFYIFVTLW
jgi:hypothetical protein